MEHREKANIMTDRMRQEVEVLEGWEDRVREIEACRICGNPALEPVVTLGAQSLSGLFDDGQPHNQLFTPIPLDVVRCDLQGKPDACGFVQLKHTVPADIMFRDYGYRSGVNTTMRLHLQRLAAEVESRILLQAGDIVVDIGANDGTTLMGYAASGMVKVGFEPSDVRPVSTGHGIRYIPSFFNSADFFAVFPGKRAKVVMSVAMFYDIDDPTHFCREIANVLAEDGLWVLEMGFWGAVLENNGFDSICHEHLGYYTLKTLRHLFEKTGFKFLDVAFNSSNGGSLRCTLVKKSSPLPIPEVNQRRIREASEKEESLGHHRPERFRQFADALQKIRRDLMQALEEARVQGKKVYGYGASTKGNVTLQTCGVESQHLIAIADRNPMKEGRFTPGTRIPICSEETMRQARPDLLLILPWHFLKEFLEREKALRAQGTRFIVPFPEVRIV